MKFTRFILPITIFLLALIPRLYLLPSRAIFTADEEYQATYAQTIVNDFHPVWIGVSAADTGFYLGPYFTYLTSFWLKVGGGDPLVLNYFAAVLGALTATLIYLLGKNLVSSKVGILAAALYAFSPLMVYFDQRYWNPGPVPFLLTLTLLALTNLSKHQWWLVVVAFCLGAFWHVHLSLAPLYLVVTWFIWRSRSMLTRPVWLTSLLVFFLMLLPLLIFDYNHAWSNLLTPMRMFNQVQISPSSSVHLTELGSTLSRFIYLVPGLSNDGEVRLTSCPGLSTPVTPWVGIIALLPLLVFLLNKTSYASRDTKLLALSTLLLSLSFIFYPGPVSSYYALALIPLYFILLAHLFQKFWWLLLPLFIFASLATLSQTDVSYGLSAKRSMITQVMQVVQTQTFSVSEVGTCHAYAGWRYLFKSYARTPSTSSADSSLGWLYPLEVSSPGTYQIILGDDSEFVPPTNPLLVLRSGGYTAYITKYPK